MTKSIMMSNKPSVTAPTTRLLLCFFSAILLTSCAQTEIIALDDSVEQLQNLDDYDRDGVIEAREKCDGTVLGAAIDNYGCGTQTSSIEPLKVDIKFANNSFILPSSAHEEIKELADFLENHQELQLHIEGHTSKVGNVELNQKLSENRAKAVALVLVDEFNIAPARVSSTGYGFDRLAVEGDTPDAHATNRRIMAELTYTNYLDDMKWTIYSVVDEL